MRRLYLSIFLLFLVANGKAQWKNIYFPNATAFGGAHDTSFFAYEQGDGVYRFSPDLKWTNPDSGLYPGYVVPAFASIGRYVMAGGFRSSDDGAYWIATKIPGNPACFTVMGRFLFAGGNDVWTSQDSGMNWIGSKSGIKNYQISSLAATDSILFAGTSSGVFRSTDSGQSWQPTSMTKAVSTLAVVDSVILAATEGAGVFRSVDVGMNWTSANVGLFNRSISTLVSNSRYLFAGTGWEAGNGDYVGGDGVFMSTDGGQHWDTINYGLPQGPSSAPSNFLSVNALGIFDTLLFVGVWDGSGTINRTYVRSIPEILRQKGDTTAGVVSQPELAGDSIMVYPNPTNASVSILAGGTSILGVRVLNILGTEMLNMRSDRAPAMSIDLSHLPSGTYFLEIATVNGTVLRKVIRE